MTRKEAIKELENIRDNFNYTLTPGEVFDMAIKALEQEPCSDCISRQAVLDIVEKEQFKGDALSEIEKLPSVNPQEPKQGHWYIDERPESNRETICSNCEKPIFEYHKLDFDYRPKYCPNCGCRMESEG